MLSRREIDAAMSTGDIRISYAFVDDVGAAVSIEAVKGDTSSDRASKKFDQNFSGNRLSITLGPLVKSNTHPHVRSRKRFRSHKSVTDLRKTGGKYKVRRGESITVNTNEHVSLGSEYGAISLPRLSLATEGLLLTSSYIDPQWRGILVLQLVNVNSRKITLKIGEKIAATHFYKVNETSLSEADADKFVDKSHHYGLSWDLLLDDDSDRDPFPQRKRPEGRFDSDLWDFVQPFWQKLTAWGITGLVIIGAVFAAGRIAEQYKDLPERVSRLENPPSQTVPQPDSSKLHEPTPAPTTP